MKAKPVDAKQKALLEANSHYLMTGLQARSLRMSISVALIMNEIDPTPETITYVAKKMVAKEDASLLDEIVALKGKARRAAGG